MQLDTAPLGEEILSPQWRRALFWIALGIGFLARFLRYALRFPLWEDECFLAYNYIGRGYAELLGPLQPHQVAPVLYLWKQATVVRLFGFTELSLRLTAFLTGVLVLFLFARVAARFVKGAPLLIAVALFAASYPCIRYAAEAKQYGIEMAVAFLLVALATRWRERPEKTGTLWLLAALVPVALGLSYSAVFVAGGVSLFVAYVARATGARRAWLPWLAFNALLVLSFVGLLMLSRNQASAELDWMRDTWKGAFPPMSRPLALVGWFFAVHAGQMFGYPVGATEGLGAPAFLCIVVAFVVFARRRRWDLFLIAFVPLFLHFVAAALQRYPYGVHPKLMFYFAPVVCILIGLGAGTIISRATSNPRRARRITIGVVVAVLCVAAGSIGRDVWSPQKTLSDDRARGFARWFWHDTQVEGESICLFTDLGLSFSPREKTELSWLYTYLCNQRIQSPRHRRGEPPRYDRSPLRFVRFRVHGIDYDEEAFQRWLGETKARFRFVGVETYPFTRFSKGERRLIHIDHIDVYTFEGKN